MKILDFGSLNIDYVYQVPHILMPGETCTAVSREVYPGGKGLNSAVALARAGANVYFAGCIGHDGQWLVDLLQNAGADVQHVAVLDTLSGHTVIQVDAHAENCIMVFPGANRENSTVHIDNVLASFEQGDFIVLQNEINNLGYIMEKAHEHGMQIVFNPSPCDEIIASLPLDKVSYLVVNEAEAAKLADVHDERPIEDVLKVLRARYPRARIVVTLGKSGALYCEGDRILRQDAFPASAVDTTGAGDTFLGNFVTGLSEGMDAAEALKLAAAAASIAVSRKGAATSIPLRRETERKLLF